ncbi:MAG: porin [Comamonas sp.]
MHNKKLLAFAAFFACTVAAHAQSSVTATGLVDMYVGSLKAPGDTGRNNVVGSGGMTTSWFGFKGTEELGGGLKANFALTGFMRADTGTPGRFDGDNFWSRDALVSLSGNFGAVTLGRTVAPNFVPTISMNPFGDSFTFSPLVLHQNVSLFNQSGWRASNPSDTGWSNQIIYSSPKIGGFSGNLHYQFGEQANQHNKNNVGLNASYASGPFAVTAFYEDVSMKNPVPSVLSESHKNWMLGASWDAGFAKAYATYGQTTGKDTDYKIKTASLGATVPLAANSRILAAYAHSKLADSTAKRDTVSVGYNYDFSKRTDGYAIVMYDKVKSYSSGTGFGVGVRHRF